MSETDNPDVAIARCDKEMADLDSLEEEIKKTDELSTVQRLNAIVKLKWAKATFSKEKQGYLRLKKDMGKLEIQATDLFKTNKRAPKGINLKEVGHELATRNSEARTSVDS